MYAIRSYYAQNQQTYQLGEALGFGFSVLVRNSTHLWLSQVFPGSTAAVAGFTRGDEILEIGESEATLVPVSGLITGGTLTAALRITSYNVCYTKVLR